MAIIESGSIPSLPRSPQLQKTMPREDFPAPDRTKPQPKQWWDSMWLLPNGSKCSRFIPFQSPSHSLRKVTPILEALQSKFVPSARSLCSIGKLKPANVASPEVKDLTLHPAASLCQAFGATNSPKTGAKRAPTWSLTVQRLHAIFH